MKQARLRHVGIVVKDLLLMINYYQKLGFKLIYSDGLEKTHQEYWGNKFIEIAKLQDSNGGIIELIAKSWFPHISLTVDELPDHGIGPWKRDDKIEVVYAQDPEGNWIEFVKEL